jgi:esterase/lipase superfamily enzyme
VLVYVSSSEGDETEFEAFQMPDAAGAWLDSGRLQVFAIDGHGPTTLFDDGLAPNERMRAYAAFERGLVSNVLPWILDRTGDSRLDVVGASYGALVAANLLFKYPARVRSACGLGGVYGLWHRLDGYHDDDVYFHTPLEYLPRLEDPRLLGAIRATSGITLYAAAADDWLDSTHQMAWVLGEKQLPHAVEVWPAPADHHERWWRLQLAAFLRRE